jgi:hypothetical protein
MADYHLSINPVKHSAGRSATAAACGVMHIDIQSTSFVTVVLLLCRLGIGGHRPLTTMLLIADALVSTTGTSCAPGSGPIS